ncbi:MAG: NAD-dependent protein deacetylase [Deltaproteobacteria bacterium]|nr:NAD-dependent protein deacetylase [Deltaproteobacteria bacterium]
MSQLPALAQLLSGRRICTLTGAGTSTASGIPDYRGPGTAARARNPVRFAQFVGDPAWRRRYWARSFSGWPALRDARPNPAHAALARMEGAGLLTGLITQNVDRLHSKAGSVDPIELHGALAEVTCLGCGALSARDALQERLAEANRGWSPPPAPELAPDGDAELDDTGGFVTVDCLRCGGLLKPHVVFFGENVPRERVDRAFAALDAAEVLLVVGSSLTVFSGMRFVKRATTQGTPVCVLNLGPTRGDAEATLCVDADAATALPALATLLGAG